MNVEDSLFLFPYDVQVLSAYVKSIEDHGYILNFGLDSFTGFMPKSNQSGKHEITCL